MISFIPLILAAGPITAYFVGDFLEKRFGFPHYVLFIAITIGALASILEVIRIIRQVLRIENKSQNV